MQTVQTSKTTLELIETSFFSFTHWCSFKGKSHGVECRMMRTVALKDAVTMYAPNHILQLATATMRASVLQPQPLLSFVSLSFTVYSCFVTALLPISMALMKDDMVDRGIHCQFHDLPLFSAIMSLR